VAKNKMSDLRDHLFETLEQLKDPEKPLEVERARAICSVSKQIIESAKTEVQYAKAVGAFPAGTFFDTNEARPQLTNGKPNGGGGDSK
jgi:hypothetical protein